MTAGTMRTTRSAAGRRVLPAVLISLTAGLGGLVAAPQAAFAASPAQAPAAAGNAHSCALEDGKAYCWGENDYGQLGDGSTADSSVPVAVDASGVLAGKALVEISAGGGGGLDTCALDAAGAAFCWGANIDGGLGGGNNGNGSSSVPVAVQTSGALAGKILTQISTGSLGACVLDAAGAAYCWGDNDFGELGDGKAASSSVPVAVDTRGVLAGKTLTQISAGFEDTCALAAAGTAYCWGDNYYWELGDGRGGANGDASSVPVAVDTRGVLAGKALAQISAGWWYACAVDTAGAAYCWGEGALGSNTGGSSVPVAVDTSGVLAGKRMAQISAGLGATCSLDRAGAAFCWGDNDYGELGDGTTAGSSVPVAVDTRGVLAGQRLTQVATGAFHACAADRSANIYCWGDNNQGDLGDGRTSMSDVPVLAGPRAPAGVTAIAGDTTAAVSWTAPASLDGGTLIGYTAISEPDGERCTTTGATSCTIRGLTDGTTYTVTVDDRTTAGDSGASAPATVTPEPARGAAGPIVSGYRTDKCIDDSKGSSANHTPVVMGHCNGSAAQNWSIKADRTIRIHGKCMDVYRHEKASKAGVELRACTGGASQQWRARNGTLVNPVSGKCLDDPRFNVTDGTQLEIYTCNGRANQQWKTAGP